jgi:hypothetical protein
VSGAPDLLLLAVVMLDLYIVATGRLHSLVRSTALQGLALALLPVALWGPHPEGRIFHIILMSVGTFAIKKMVDYMDATDRDIAIYEQRLGSHEGFWPKFAYVLIKKLADASVAKNLPAIFA